MSDIIEKKLEIILKSIKPLAEYREDMNLQSDLNMDSLDVMSFLFEVEAQCNIKVPEEDIDAKRLLNLGNLCSYIHNKINMAK